jgi:hypothetical protein
MSSPAKERDIENVKTYIDHLSSIRFNGTLLIVFEQGAPKYVSRKEELSTDLLDKFIHRPVIVRTKKPLEVQIPESTENIETTAKTKDETTPEEPGKF